MLCKYTVGTETVLFQLTISPSSSYFVFCLLSVQVCRPIHCFGHMSVPIHILAMSLCFLDLSISDIPIGRVVISLYSDQVPRTAANFLHLCKGDTRTPQGVKLTYKGCQFHRVIRDFMVQGGDITAGDGTGGLSIYGSKFEDERMDIHHDRPGLVSMANKGPNTNSSQFFVTLKPCRALDGHHVVFGEVLQGFQLCLKVAKVRTDDNSRPLERVKVDECGELPCLPATEVKHKHRHKHRERGKRKRSRSRS